VRDTSARARSKAALAVRRRGPPRGSPDALSITLDDPRLGLDELLRLLGSRRVPASVIERIGGDPRWTRHAAVRRRLALHPAAPTRLALRLTPQLGWRDLVEIASDPRRSAVLRRAAERDLEARVEQLTVGEQIALARGAPAAVARSLLGSGEARVLASLLDNPRLREQDVVGIASAADAAPELLARLAGHPEWGGRHAVRLAVAANRRTPIATALRVVAILDRRGLRRLGRDATVSAIVRIGADRRLHALRRAEARPGSG